MRISNVGMFVKDLERAKDFFVEYFHATVHCQYQEDNGFKEYILKFDEGPKLEIMTKPEIVDEKKSAAGYKTDSAFYSSLFFCSSQYFPSCTV